jgi:predicted  nucleic acid-binding Zn-ribbon protein
MTLDPAEILEKLVEIQQTDSGLDELERLQKNLQNESQSIDSDITSLKTSLQAQKKSAEELVKLRRTVEVEIKTLDEKIKKYQGQESEVKSNEQFVALKQEIDKGKEEKLKAEEKVLDFLYQEDDQKKKAQELAAQLEQTEKKASNDRQVLRQKILECHQAADVKLAQRKAQLSALPEDWAGVYETLRNSGKKIAVAQIQEDKTCGGCHMNVPPQILNEVKKGIQIQQCNCSRIIYLGA